MIYDLIEQNGIVSMKRTIKISAIAPIIFLPLLLFAQPQPWDPGAGGGEDANPVGAVPIGSGIILLLGMGFGYGLKRVYDFRRVDQRE